MIEENLHLRSDVAWLAERAAYFAYNHTTNASGAGVFQASSNSTSQLIRELQFATAKSIRTSTIILASFNAVAAFATALGILYDAYAARARTARQYRADCRPKTSFIPPAELYPFIVSCGIVVQGTAFAVAQAQGLTGLLSTGCAIVAQFLLPALFLVPSIQLIFGLEFVIRSLRRTQPFSPRAKYSTAVCLVVVGVLLVVNILVADLARAPNVCFASLFWFIAVYARGIVAALLSVDVALVLCAVTLFVRLMRSTRVEAAERVSASRMVYYLALAVVSNTLVIPFFFSLAFRHKRSHGEWNGPITLSMVASVVANVTGLLTGGLHLFLRSSTTATIGPREKITEFERSRIKGSIRRYRGSQHSSQPDFASHITGPVGGGGTTDLRRMRSDATLIKATIYEAKEEEAGITLSRSRSVGSSPPNPLRSNAYHPPSPPTAAAPPPPLTLSTTDAAAAATVRAPEPAQMAASPRSPVEDDDDDYDYDDDINNNKNNNTASIPVVLLESAPASPVRRQDPPPPDMNVPLLLLPATTYTPGGPAKAQQAQSQAQAPVEKSRTRSRFDLTSLLPPPSLTSIIGRRHRRDSSVVSSATVQIGLRLSNVADLNPMVSQIFDPKTYGWGRQANSGSTLSVASIPPMQQEQQQPPQQQQEPVPQLLAPTVFSPPKPQTTLSPFVSSPLVPRPLQPQPQQPQQQKQATLPATVFVARSSPLANVMIDDDDDESRRSSEDQDRDRDSGELLPLALFEDPEPASRDDARMKTLPPVPLFQQARPREYSPEDVESAYGVLPSPTSSVGTLAMKLPSPRGVGFATVPRSKSSAALRTLAASNSGNSVNGGGLSRSPSAAAVLSGSASTRSSKTASDWI